jgi:hypothetical protein
MHRGRLGMCIGFVVAHTASTEDRQSISSCWLDTHRRKVVDGQRRVKPSGDEVRLLSNIKRSCLHVVCGMAGAAKDWSLTCD